MASAVPLLKDPQKKMVQETLLRYGISPKTAYSNASVELRKFSQKELTATLQKVAKRGPDLRSFEFAPTSLFSRLILTESSPTAWLKPPLNLIERSAAEGLALCVNAAGEWALLKDDYFAISHVWEEGIQADPENRGIRLAHVQQIIQRIQQTGAKWIWLDGLAIPGSSKTLTLHEEELKIAIINNLANIYRQANSVIIFDALVMHLQSTDLVDVAICLSCGKWMTRVWTFQEICLAQKALVVTRNGIVDFLHITRRLRALSGNDGHMPEIFGTTKSDLDNMTREERNADKYEELYLNFIRLLGTDGKKPSLAQLAMVCFNRKTGNDIDYARAFFPVLGLTWKTKLTREEGMELIYDEQKFYAKRLLLMHGSPRSAVRPGWAPSYLVGLEGQPIGPDDLLGDIEWEKRGLKRKWYTYKVKAQHPTDKKNGLFLELSVEDSVGVLCGCETSSNERIESINGFRDAVSKNTAYVLSNKILTFPPANGMGYNVMLVERDSEVPDANEAWVFLTGSVTAMQKSLSAKTDSWLILHESPISDHIQGGKVYSKMARMMSDEKALHTGQTPLHIAAESGDEVTLKQFLQANREGIHSRDVKGWTPLHTAAFNGHVLPVRLLLEYGASVDAEDYFERSPLMVAADEGQTDAVKELVQHGANLNLSSRNALSPLNQALIRGHVDTVKALLTAGANPIGQDQFGFAPLLVACGKDVQLIDLLISAGADPSADLVGGVTALHCAAKAGNVPILERLLELGMLVDLPVGELVSGETPLYNAIEEQSEAAVSLLLSRGANPNHAVGTTWTCVLLAAKTGHYNITKMLVEHGSDVHTTCKPENWTALHIACHNGHRLIVKLLLHWNWNVNARDADGATPLRLARQAGHLAVVEILQNAGGV